MQCDDQIDGQKILEINCKSRNWLKLDLSVILIDQFPNPENGCLETRDHPSGKSCISGFGKVLSRFPFPLDDSLPPAWLQSKLWVPIIL